MKSTDPPDSGTKSMISVQSNHPSDLVRNPYVSYEEEKMTTPDRINLGDIEPIMQGSIKIKQQYNPTSRSLQEIYISEYVIPKLIFA